VFQPGDDLNAGGVQGEAASRFGGQKLVVDASVERSGELTIELIGRHLGTGKSRCVTPRQLRRARDVPAREIVALAVREHLRA
jgi:hypothetical protein